MYEYRLIKRLNGRGDIFSIGRTERGGIKYSTIRKVGFIFGRILTFSFSAISSQYEAIEVVRFAESVKALEV